MTKKLSVPQQFRGWWNRRRATSDPRKKAVLCGALLLLLLLACRLALGGRVATVESKTAAGSTMERAPSFALSSTLGNGSNNGTTSLEPTVRDEEVIIDVRVNDVRIKRRSNNRHPGFAKFRCRLYPQCNTSTCYTDSYLAFRGVVKSVVTITGAACLLRLGPNVFAVDVRHIVVEFITAYSPTHQPSWWRQSPYVPGQVIHLFDDVRSRSTAFCINCFSRDIAASRTLSGERK